MNEWMTCVIIYPSLHDSLPGWEPNWVLPGSNSSGHGHLQEQSAGGKIFLVGVRPH